MKPKEAEIAIKKCILRKEEIGRKPSTLEDL